MYLDLFKLKELPFRLSPDPQFLYLSKQHARAKAYMESTIWFTDGFVVITGEIGAGKTTLIESFLKEIQTDVVVAQVNQTQVSAVDFLQAVLVQFGFSPFKMKKGELIATLNNFLIEQHGAGRKVLLIVDEAQNLSLRVLEEIRLLSGVETTKEKVLRIILAGQPELNDKLDAPELIQLAQRIRLRFHLARCRHRRCARTSSTVSRSRAQGDRQIFVRRHVQRNLPLHRRRAASREHAVRYRDDGRVRRQQRDCVTLGDVAQAIDELRWVEFAARQQQTAGEDRRQPHVGQSRCDGYGRDGRYADCEWHRHGYGAAPRSAASSSQRMDARFRKCR